MLPLRSFFCICCLVAISSQVCALEPQSEERTSRLQELDLGLEINEDTGEVTWLPVSRLEEFLSLSPEALVELGVREGEQERYELRADRLVNPFHGLCCQDVKRREQCPKPFPRHAEYAYVRPSDANSSEPRTTIQDLIDRADRALIVTVGHTDVGFAWGAFGRKVEASVVDDLTSDENTVPEGTEIHFLRDIYDTSFRGSQVCQRLPGFFEENSGDVVLILGRFNQETQQFLVANLFEVERGLVLPQPYDFLRQEVLILDSY